VVVGSIAAMKRGSWMDRGLVAITLLGISAPTFLIAIGLQWLLAYRLRLLPFDGFGATFGERAVHVVLPALTLGIFGAAYYTRIVRDEVVVERGRDYVRTALAKGAAPATVLVKHVLRNVALPLVTLVGLDFGALIGGAIVTEKIFRWPGLGSLSVDAVISRDGPVVMGTVLVAATAVVTANMLVDASYALLDPRTRR
jgi:peptide/nickel transport system permease protein